MWRWLLALAALPPAGRLYQAWGVRRDARRWPPPGRFIAGLHAFDSGAGPAAVVLEAGIAASSASWTLVEELLRGQMRVVSYDRAGLGYSPAASTPRTLDNLIAELNLLVEAARVPAPFILAGHSFGGLLARHYAACYPSKVAALVLVDPLEPFEWHPLTETRRAMLARGAALSRRGAALARWGVVRLGLELLLAGSRRLPLLLAKAASGQGSAITGRLAGEIGKLPPQVWPRIKAHWCLPRSFSTMAEYLARLPEYCRAPLDAGALARIPVHVISAGNAPEQVRDAHRAAAASSPGGTHVTAEGAGHWVQIDAPALVAEVIRAAALHRRAAV